jgi:gamma-glutamyltranspeptidase / glutathione hydrolase
MKAWSGMPDESVRELRKSGPDVRFDVGGYRGYDAIKAETHNEGCVYVDSSESGKDGKRRY